MKSQRKNTLFRRSQSKNALHEIAEDKHSFHEIIGEMLLPFIARENTLLIKPKDRPLCQIAEIYLIIKIAGIK